jgi:hypothetical protein
MTPKSSICFADTNWLPTFGGGTYAGGERGCAPHPHVTKTKQHRTTDKTLFATLDTERPVLGAPRMSQASASGFI